MKSFIVALFLLLSVGLFVTATAIRTVNCVDTLQSMADKLPKTEETFLRTDDIEDHVYALLALWDQEFPSIVCTAGYENTNRCDEAIRALNIHFQNKNGSDFSVALSQFCDGLSRLRILEGIHWQGIL